MKTKHTPEPWTIDDTMAKDKTIHLLWYNIKDKYGHSIAEVKGQHYGIDNDVAEANVNLLVNSPQLLSALKICHKALKTYGKHPIIDAQVRKVLKSINNY